MNTTRAMPGSPDGRFSASLDRAKGDRGTLLDLTEADPARCGLQLDGAELDAILARQGAATAEDLHEALPRARDAVASYLPGRGGSISPDRIRFTTSRDLAHRLALRMVCAPGDEVLVPSPSDPWMQNAAAAESMRAAGYALRFGGEWRLHRRDVERAVTPRTRAILVGNPSEPTGALLHRDDLAFLERLCARNGMALIADEAFAETTVVPCASVTEVTGCLAVQISGIPGVCGVPGSIEWCAVAGPDALAGPALSRADAVHDLGTATTAPALFAVPALLARRERFLTLLRNRLAGNRASLAEGAVRECPWSLLWGAGGRWAVLEVGTAEPEDVLCDALLEVGVAVQPGSRFGLPDRGYLVVSLLPFPDVFREALVRVDRRLRTPFAS